MKIELTEKEQLLVYRIRKITFFLFACILSTTIMATGLYTVTLMDTLGLIHGRIEITASVAIAIGVCFFASAALFNYYKK